jgi:hypothetical protein
MTKVFTFFQACHLIGESVNWKKEIVFGAISEWHLPFLIKICSKKSSIRHCTDCPLFQLNRDVFSASDDSTKDVSKNDDSTKDVVNNVDSTNDVSKKGVIVKQLDRKYCHLVNNAWKFRDQHTQAWYNSC